MKATLRAAALAGTVSLIALAQPALAQDAAVPAEAEATSLDEAPPGEIVVTAQKRSERLQDVPVAVSVLSGEQLGSASRPSVESAAQQVPALNFLKSGTTLNQTIFLRGVGTASFSIAGEPSVSTVVDGVVYARSGEAFSDLVDIDRLEVLRGPQGTLFGKNASAGVLNITTKMPKVGEFGGTLEASYFDRKEYRGKAAVNVPLGENAAGRFTAFYGNYAGNIRNLTAGKRVNGYEHYGARAQFLYEPSDALRLYATADYHKNDDDCCADIIATGPLTGAGAPTTNLAFNVLPTPRGAKTRRITQDLITATKERGWGVSLQADVGVGTHTLTSITAYRDWDNTEIRDGDWLDRAYVGFNQLHDNGPQRTHTLTQELRLTSPANQVISYVLGGYYSNAYSRRVFTRNDVVCTAVTGAPTNVLIPCGSPNANPSTTPSGTADFGSRFKNYAAFGQATLNATDTFRLIGGLRYSKDDLSVFHKRVATGLAVSGGLPQAAPGIQPNFDQGVYDRYLALVATGVSPTTAAAQAVTASNGVAFRTKTTADNLSGKISAQFDFTRDHMGYLSYTRGYKGPAYNIFFNLTATGTNRISPETSDAFEIGLKNTLLDGRMTLNLALFRADYHNFQANNPDLVAGVVVTRFTNAGEVSTRGIEADMNWRPFDDFTLNGGVAYTKARVDRFNAPAGAATIPPRTPLGYAPKWKGSLAADYRWRTGGAIDVWLGASTNFQSSQLSLFAANAVQRQLGTIPKYALVNAQIGFGDPDDTWRITAQVRNLTDKEYAAAIINGGPGGSYRYQIPRDADRYIGVTGRLNF
ncbi:TonB-dependent receptor [Novosphingobium sp. Gsoil 351]|uniref:TonB-dependent receptor n=1 Tax=Novosphingobium sp. Gsoil 351 TaxID=2675225 RepID=UPI0012B4FEAF|nr:TonB-dependent receptor [Novosphingobium sp. Gsoil 351]QGN53852.1 TonB-dependent receptor [Novosphingobium sp. Gsoil 351]